jgi:predicted SPOUT superfamily RNA methylase MTH1
MEFRPSMFKRNRDPLAPPRKQQRRLADRTGMNAGAIGSISGGGSFSDPASSAPRQKGALPAARSSKPKDAGAVSEAMEPPPLPRGRPWTVSVAIAGSIVDNAQTHELRSQLVGQVARACAIFNVDEIVVFTPSDDGRPPVAVNGGREEGRAKRTDGAVFMARLLQYLECPQYLRKHIFPVHPDLRHVGLLAPLDAPHHLRIEEVCEYREAVVISPGSGAGSTSSSGSSATHMADDDSRSHEAGGSSSVIYTGLRKELKIGHALPVGTRVTVRMPSAGSSNARAATVVPPREPRERLGMYWGYDVRVAKGLPAVWSECPYEGGYDTTLGTSEHGIAVAGLGGGGSAAAGSSKNVGSGPVSSGGTGGPGTGATGFSLPPFRHLLLVFGGVEGLEPVVAMDDELSELEDDMSCLFDHYLNLCPNQGSRTIRTEEALLVGLSALKPHIERAGAQM